MLAILLRVSLFTLKMEWISNSSSIGKGLQPTLLCCQRQGCVLGSGRKKTAIPKPIKWVEMLLIAKQMLARNSNTVNLIHYINQLWPIQTWYVTLSCNYHMVDSWYGFGRVPCSLPCFPILFNWNTSYEYYKLEHRFQWHKFGSKWELHIRDWQVQAFNYACSTSSM